MEYDITILETPDDVGWTRMPSIKIRRICDGPCGDVKFLLQNVTSIQPSRLTDYLGSSHVEQVEGSS